MCFEIFVSNKQISKRVTFQDPLTSIIQDRTYKIHPFDPRNLNKTEIRALRIILGNPIFPYAVPDETPKENQNEIYRIEEIETIDIPPSRFNSEYYKNLLEESNSAIRNRKSSIIQFQDNLYEQDQIERIDNTTGFRSHYEDYNITNRWFGDTELGLGNSEQGRFWYNTSPHIVDGTVKTKCYVDSPTSTYRFDSEYYYSHYTQYKKVIIPLTPHVTCREYGRVFFHTETRYISWDIPILPRRKVQKIEGFVIKGKQRIFTKSYKNPLKDILYTTDGNGILKRHTLEGKRIDLIFWNLELYRAGYPTYSSPYEGNVLKTLWYQITKSFYDIENWVSNLERQVPSGEQSRAIDQLYWYYREQRHIEEHITETLINSIKYRVYCRRIQRFWITRGYLPRLRATITIRESYRRYLSKRIGRGHSIYPNDHDSDTD